MRTFWQGLGTSARYGLVAGIALIVVGTIAFGAWVMRTERDVLFGRLSAQDAAAMTTELDRMKVPYELAADGTTILVDRKTLHQTRLKLMSKDLPLHGAVGFELFNNTDFGMTEFAQKVNFQRALQGEITRTILSLAEVESARVHLAFPEEGLFKRDQGKAKAAITLALKQGQTLRPEQVRGIQRLVASSVAGIGPQDVTIVDQTGVALTRVSQPAADGGGDMSPQLELKREIEQHLAQKASQVLDRAFGPGRALASVDVVLDMNQVRRTTEDVLAAPAQPGEAITGVVVRARETTKEDVLPATNTRDGSRGTSNAQRETDYQVGRRVEQVVSQPGSIRNLQVLAVVKVPLDAQQVERTKALLAAAVGASTSRGDVVVVQPLAGLNALAPTSQDETPAPIPSSATRLADEAPIVSQAQQPATQDSPRQVILALAVLVAVLVFGLVTWALASRNARARHRTPLSDTERQAALARVRGWLDAEPPQPGAQR
ncbi:flagellar M-ring protein FliF [Roseateles sp. YR242]|uniref:flagellar basal-body MS-ring/collar protein FliF n=1 Tax=Roseateles sp. YR242 TaxID=1855305 RepID=UPI0008C7A4B4|nr:flagellar basal-body MS-ring/collar protein FliF [Roseateles sp. YR242]SEK93108.1 flagellar M-ring protein FliF [Roseateles sp. YR242]